MPSNNDRVSKQKSFSDFAQKMWKNIRFKFEFFFTRDFPIKNFYKGFPFKMNQILIRDFPLKFTRDFLIKKIITLKFTGDFLIKKIIREFPIK